MDFGTAFVCLIDSSAILFHLSIIQVRYMQRQVIKSLKLAAWECAFPLEVDSSSSISAL